MQHAAVVAKPLKAQAQYIVLLRMLANASCMAIMAFLTWHCAQGFVSLGTLAPPMHRYPAPCCSSLHTDCSKWC